MSAEQLDSHEAAQPEDKAGEQPPRAFFALEYDEKSQSFTPGMVGNMPTAGLLMNLAASYFQIMMAELTKAAAGQGPARGGILGPGGMPIPPSVMGTFGRRRQN